ncbi:MAG: hypothetical protein HFH55_05405 [Lachnospiraceae bacterium]|nr:hypothetical protein [Lachnospiraceae bacterium]
MIEKDMRLLVNEELEIVVALLKTIDIAIGNREYFGDDGQSVAITLDIAITKIGECRGLLDF